MDKENNNNLAGQLRGCSLCGQCKSSTFLAWLADGQASVSSGDLPKGAFKNKELKSWYMVRCNFFKFTVSNPEALEICEAFADIE